MQRSPLYRALAGASAAVLATAALAGCSNDTTNAGTVKIGFLASMTGIYTAVGTDMRDGFQLYLNTHNNQLGGRTVDLVVADEGDGPATAVPAAQKLLDQDGVVALAGLVGGGSVDKVQTLTTEAQIPMIGANARPAFAPTKNPDGTEAPRDLTYTWHTSYSSDEPGIAIAGYVRKQVGNGTVFAIGPDYQGGHDELRGFVDTYTGLGGKLANRDGKVVFTPHPATTDFTSYLNEAALLSPDAVYTFYAGAAAVPFVESYRKSDLADVPLYAAGFLTEDVPFSDKHIGIVTSLNYAPDLGNKANQDFVAAWRTHGHDKPPTTYAMAAYDAAAVLDKAIGAVQGEVTGQAINTALGQVGRITSPRGDWSFNAEHRPTQPWYLRTVAADGAALGNVVLQQLTTLPAAG